MKPRMMMAAATMFAVSAPTMAVPLKLYPVQAGQEQQRYRLGVPTLQLETDSGAILITPLPFDHGHPRFKIAVFNDARSPADFGIENIAATAGEVALPLYSREQLQRQAKTRATWSKIGIAMTTGFAAGATSNEHSDFQSAVIQEEGFEKLDRIQTRLDYTLDHLAQDVVQTTTIDPEAYYGGVIELADTDKLKTPSDIRLVFQWNGQAYPFTFRLTHEGEAVPPPFTSTPLRLVGLAAKPAPPATIGVLHRASYAPAVAEDPYDAGRRAAAAALAASGGDEGD